MISPCMACSDRKEACHSKCEKYAAYKSRLSMKRPATELYVIGYWAERKHRQMKQVTKYHRKHA